MCVRGKHGWFCVCCWNQDWLFKHDDRAKFKPSNFYPAFIFFKDFTNPLRRANWYTYLLTVDSKHIYPKRRANLTYTEVSPKVYGRIWVVLKISTFWFSYFNSGLFAGLYDILFSITRVSLTQKTLLIRSHSRKGITCYSLGQALSFKLYRN